MNINNLFLLIVILISLVHVDAWRRRRRRRSCSAVACGYNWSAWTQCNCLGRSTRNAVVYRHPSCGGSGCPTSQVRTCNGACVAGAGVCTNGVCKCNAGRQGTRCESTCGHNRYGVNCAGTCNCGARGCNPVTGVCNCSPAHCLWSWNSWSTCKCTNQRTRGMTITRNPSCGGNACPSNREETGTCNGSCVKGGGECNTGTGLCQCYAGRRGVRCELSCPTGTYGFNCQQSCSCPNGCDPRTGDCKCSPVSCSSIWTAWSSCNCLGKRVRSISVVKQPSCGGTLCPSSPDNDTCEARICEKTGGYCDDKTGLCECFAGRNGTRCELSCPSGTYGVNCMRQCNCSNGCDARTGECIVGCKYTWSSWSTCNCLGRRTRHISITQQPSGGGTPCPASPDVATCEPRICEENGGYCNSESGDCECFAGRNGTRCELSCPPGTYGVNCMRQCNCSNGCDARTGECIVGCKYTWSSWSTCNCLGRRTRRISITQQPSCGGTPCPINATEDEQCSNGVCVEDGGECNKKFGFCQCYAGRNGSRCELTCPNGTYGLNCARACNNCTNGCDFRTGECKCTPIPCSYSWSNWSSCNCLGQRMRVMRINRPASCNGTPCPSKVFNTTTCATGGCLKGGFCHRSTGLCKCPPGMMGARCELHCPPGRYGFDCSYTCKCKKGVSCDAKSGRCNCSGKHCIDINVTVDLMKDSEKGVSEM